MKSKVFTYDPEKLGQQKGVNFIMGVYGYDYRKALSIYRKIEYRIAQKTDTTKMTTFAYQKFVTQSIIGETEMKTKAFIDYKGNISIDYASETDEFKYEVERRLHNFKEKYQNTDIGAIIDDYLSPNGTTDFETLKSEIEEFKRSSTQYMAGSEPTRKKK